MSPHHILSLQVIFFYIKTVCDQNLLAKLVSANADLVACDEHLLPCKEKLKEENRSFFFFASSSHPTILLMPTSLYVHMVWANIVVKHNKVWNKTLDDLVSKVQDSSQHCNQTEGHHVGPRWNTFSLDALECRNWSDAVWWKGKIEQAINDLKLACMQKSLGGYDLKIGYMPKLSSKTGHWKFEYTPKTKLQSLWLGNWVHTKKLGFKAYDGKLTICQN